MIAFISQKPSKKMETFSIFQWKIWRPRKELALSSQAVAVGPPVCRAWPRKESRLLRLICSLSKSCRHAGSTAFSTEGKHSSNWSAAGFPGPVTHSLFWRHRLLAFPPSCTSVKRHGPSISVSQPTPDFSKPHVSLTLQWAWTLAFLLAFMLLWI